MSLPASQIKTNAPLLINKLHKKNIPSKIVAAALLARSDHPPSLTPDLQEEMFLVLFLDYKKYEDKIKTKVMAIRNEFQEFAKSHTGTPEELKTKEKELEKKGRLIRSNMETLEEIANLSSTTISDDFLPVLTKLTNNKSPAVRARAVLAIAAIEGEKAKQALDKLSKLKDDPSSDVRTNYQEALRLKASFIPEQKSIERDFDLLKSHEPRIRNGAFERLMFKTGPEAVPVALKKVGDPDIDVVTASLGILSKHASAVVQFKSWVEISPQ